MYLSSGRELWSRASQLLSNMFGLVCGAVSAMTNPTATSFELQREVPGAVLGILGHARASVAATAAGGRVGATAPAVRRGSSRSWRRFFSRLCNVPHIENARTRSLIPHRAESMKADPDLLCREYKANHEAEQPKVKWIYSGVDKLGRRGATARQLLGCSTTATDQCGPGRTKPSEPPLARANEIGSPTWTSNNAAVIKRAYTNQT